MSNTCDELNRKQVFHFKLVGSGRLLSVFFYDFELNNWQLILLFVTH